MASGLSGENLDIQAIFTQYEDLAAAARLYFSPSNPDYEVRFFSTSADNVEKQCLNSLNEISRNYSLSVLAAVEAAFRVDYIIRVKLRKKDDVSRAFRELHRRKPLRVSLEEDIFKTWKQHTTVPSKIIGDMVGAFGFRHWLAHGRYWPHKLGQTYDFFSIYALALQLLTALPLEA